MSGEVAQVSAERRILERALRDVAGRSLKSEITRTWLQRARELMAETNLSSGRMARHAAHAASAHILPYRDFPWSLLQVAGRGSGEGSAASAQPSPWTFGNSGFFALTKVDIALGGQIEGRLLLRRAPHAPAHNAVPLFTQG